MVQKKPDHLITVFAGVDKDAVDAARQHMFPFSIIAMYGFVQKTENWFTC
jgi:putative YphP/YqiW family bacilliredoxin